MAEERTEFRRLLSPIKLGDVELKNRIVFLPHFSGHGRDSVTTQKIVDHYVERAKGGAALVIVSYAVQPEGCMIEEVMCAQNPNSEKNCRLMTDGVHKYGAKIFSQLTHQGHTCIRRQPPVLYAPTQMPSPHCHYNTKEIEKEEMEDIKRNFVKSAIWLKNLGFDGVEIKIAHDGILRTFVSPYFNLRTDEYGGSYENRMRFPLEIINEVREAMGNGYPVGVRLCMDEFTEWGYSHDYGLKMAKTLEEAGVDYISADTGTFSSYLMQIPPAAVPLGFGIYLSAALKKEIKIPVIAFGRINDPTMAEQVLEEGNGDLIGMCRQLLCDPETPNKIAEGRTDDIRACIGCSESCVNNLPVSIFCAQNPGVGRENEYGIGSLKEAEKVKNIMVIGAGVSGLKTAEILARRGHKVSLYEEDEEFGGQLNLAAKVPLKNDVEDIIRYIKTQVIKLGVDFHLNTEVDVNMVNELNPDVVVVATGSYPYIPAVKGQDESNIRIISPNDAVSKPSLIGKNVFLYDDIGYWQGIGVAHFAAIHGAKVTVVTADLQAGAELFSAFRDIQHTLLYEKGAEFITMHTIDSIKKDTVVIKNKFSNKTTEIGPFDTLIYASYSLSNNKLYKQLKAIRKNVYSIGDCVSPRRSDINIFESEKLARSI